MNSSKVRKGAKCMQCSLHISDYPYIKYYVGGLKILNEKCEVLTGLS